MNQSVNLEKEQHYGRLAAAHAARNGGVAFTIQPGMPEWEAWACYFGYLGFRPYIMGLVEKKKHQLMTVPTRWPVEFDQSFAKVQKNPVYK